MTAMSRPARSQPRSTLAYAAWIVCKAYQWQANSYLVKPVDLTDFTSLLEAFGCYWLAWNQYPHPVVTGPT
jgi:hypothetical protein